MNCKEICELLTAYLDSEVTPEEKADIEAHLPGCPHCRTELEALSATQVSLRDVLKSMAEEVLPSPQAWDKVQARLDKKGGWLDGLHRLLTSRTWQVATVTATVVVIAVVAAIWQFSGVGQAPPTPGPVPTIPAPPTETPVPAPVVPRPAPPPPYEVRVVPEEAHYLPGEPVEIKLSITNVSSETITMSPYPPEIVVTPGLDYDWVLFSQTGGTEEKELRPGETATVEFVWDQKDNTGKQVPPGWYNVRSRNITVRQEGSRGTFTPGTRVLIQYPQGVMEKSFDVNQSQTVNGITITLERVELTADSSRFYFFFIPPGYTASPTHLGMPPMPPPDSVTASGAEYTVGGITKNAGDAGFNTKGDGIRLVWTVGPGKLDPVPSDAREITFTITQLNDRQGPWKFRIPLQ